MDEIYYVYFDDDKKKYYFYNSQTNKTSYRKPINGTLLDPQTNKEWIDPRHRSDSVFEKHRKVETRQRSGSTRVRRAKEKGSKTLINDKKDTKLENESNDRFNTISDSTNPLPPEDLKAEDVLPIQTNDVLPIQPNDLSTDPPKDDLKVESTVDPLVETSNDPRISFDLEIPPEVENFTSRSHQFSLRPKSFMPGEDGNVPMLPHDLSEDIQKFKIEEFAKQYFREHRSKHLFQRKKISTDELVSFSTEPLQAPFLQSLKEEESIKAIQIFKEILVYTGVEQSKKPFASAEKIIKILGDYPILRDEAFFQIIKQTRNNPKEDVLLKTWHLFLIFATFFPSTQDSELYIKSHLSDFCRSPNPDVSTYAKFTYIRFCGRCSVGKPLVYKDLSLIQKIPSHPMDCKQIFGSSIYEQLWNKRQEFPNLPIPIYFYKIVQDFLNQDCQSQEGIFRINGNIQKIDNVANQINEGKYDLTKCQPNDIAGLLKHWIRELPVGMIPFNNLNDLLTICEDGKVMEFVDKLPKAHYHILKYLIGLLKIISENSEINLMKPHNLAVCFTPTVIKIKEDFTQDFYRKYSDSGIVLIKTLIESWDVSDFFPLDEKYLKQ